MKVVWYLLTVVVGAIGVLALLRFVEALLTGLGVFPVQFLIALICLVAAWQCLLKARSA